VRAAIGAGLEMAGDRLARLGRLLDALLALDEVGVGELAELFVRLTAATVRAAAARRKRGAGGCLFFSASSSSSVRLTPRPACGRAVFRPPAPVVAPSPGRGRGRGAATTSGFSSRTTRGPLICAGLGTKVGRGATGGGAARLFSVMVGRCTCGRAPPSAVCERGAVPGAERTGPGVELPPIGGDVAGGGLGAAAGASAATRGASVGPAGATGCIEGTTCGVNFTAGGSVGAAGVRACPVLGCSALGRSGACRSATAVAGESSP